MKIFFLDEKKNIIGVQYIYDVEEDKKKDWNSYEQIISVPKGSKYMQLHIWARGDKEKDGFLEMKNYSIIPYKDMIMMDNMFLFEGSKWDEFMKVNKNSLNIDYKRIDTMGREISVDNQKNQDLLISFGESANPLWKESFGGNRLDMAINGIRGGFFTDKTGTAKIEVVLRKPYYLGLILLFLGVLGSLLALVVVKKNKGGKH